MHQQDMLIFFEYQRQIFGICPCCGDFFRLSDTKIYKDERKSTDWLDKLGKEEEKIQLLQDQQFAALVGAWQPVFCRNPWLQVVDRESQRLLDLFASG